MNKTGFNTDVRMNIEAETQTRADDLDCLIHCMKEKLKKFLLVIANYDFSPKFIVSEKSCRCVFCIYNYSSEGNVVMRLEKNHGIP